jgi:hypothetical protein
MSDAIRSFDHDRVLHVLRTWSRAIMIEETRLKWTHGKIYVERQEKRDYIKNNIVQFALCSLQKENSNGHK